MDYREAEAITASMTMNPMTIELNARKSNFHRIAYQMIPGMMVLGSPMTLLRFN